VNFTVTSHKEFAGMLAPQFVPVIWKGPVVEGAVTGAGTGPEFVKWKVTGKLDRPKGTLPKFWLDGLTAMGGGAMPVPLSVMVLGLVVVLSQM
jgi:hypothetical protein